MTEYKNKKPNDYKELFKRYLTYSNDKIDPVDFVLTAPNNSDKVDKYINGIEKFLSDKSVFIHPKSNAKYNHASQITMTQLRRMYGDLKKIDVNGADQVILSQIKLKRIQLTYIAGRQEKLEAKFFCQLLIEAIKRMQTKGEFENFMRFFDAIISFHKYHDKK